MWARWRLNCYEMAELLRNLKIHLRLSKTSLRLHVRTEINDVSTNLPFIYNSYIILIHSFKLLHFIQVLIILLPVLFIVKHEALLFVNVNWDPNNVHKVSLT